ncbi:Uncharacterised protein [Candidatus Burarchaeum australiense]|nr:Uncharacterised protein [Candidatus Burarchaeum australiense]
MHELTNLELRFIVGELQGLAGSRLDNIYGAGERRFRLRFRMQNSATAELVIDLQNKLLYLTRRVEKAPPHPDDFVMGLRSKLENAKVNLLVQHGFDRVAVLELGTEEKLLLIVELFSNGNLVLCDSAYKILRCLTNEQWKDRYVRPGEKYVFPHARSVDPRELDEGTLSKLMNEKHIIATLARAVPIGTIYLEEALAQSDIEPTEMGRAVDGKRLRKLAGIISGICNAPSMRTYELENGRREFALCELSNHAQARVTLFSTLSDAIDEAVSTSAAPVQKQDRALEIEKERLGHMLREQETALERYEREAGEAKEKGDALYANYEKAEAALEEGKKEKKQKVELEL